MTTGGSLGRMPPVKVKHRVWGSSQEEAPDVSMDQDVIGSRNRGGGGQPVNRGCVTGGLSDQMHYREFEFLSRDIPHTGGKPKYSGNGS